MPIRRLGLALGEAAEIRTAWLRMPSWRLELSVQVYRRLAATTYQYASAGGSYVAQLQVNTNGFVTHDPELWQQQA